MPKNITIRLGPADSPVDQSLVVLWTQVASSRMDSVAPSPAPPPDNIAGVIDAWGSAVFDTVNNRFLLWGGGHGDTSDNSVYAFDLDTLTWARPFGPTSNAIINASGSLSGTGYYATNASGGTPDFTQPRARHTYACLSWYSGKMWSVAGVATYQTAQLSENIDAFDAVTNTFSRIASSGPKSFDYDGVSCADGSGNLWHYGSGGNNGFLWHYNIVSNTWIAHGVQFGDVNATGGLQTTPIYEPTTNRMIAIGQGKFVTWLLSASAGNIDHVDQVTTGPQTIVNAKAPGLAIHPGTGKIIGWAGGVSAFSLDPVSHVWEAIPIDPTNSVTPTAANAAGTYGRFQYSPTSGKFVCVNAVNENVYLLEL